MRLGRESIENRGRKDVRVAAEGLDTPSFTEYRCSNAIGGTWTYKRRDPRAGDDYQTSRPANGHTRQSLWLLCHEQEAARPWKFAVAVCRSVSWTRVGRDKHRPLSPLIACANVMSPVGFSPRQGCDSLSKILSRCTGSIGKSAQGLGGR